MKLFFSKLLFTVTVLLSILAALFLLLVISGIRPYILKSDSMSPTYIAGSLVLVNTNTKVDDVHQNDVLVYRAETGTFVMHRMIAEDTFQGDANETAEHVSLTDANFIGIAIFALPGFGYFIDRFLSFIWLPWCAVIASVVLSCLPWHSNFNFQSEEISNVQS